ncbi:MAG: response regulator transcription factor [Anaerolineae bacterium]|nr:response regulator transcription factor [Anaerolineae bacterium]
MPQVWDRPRSSWPAGYIPQERQATVNAAARILVVDDDESILDFIGEVLADEGYVTVTASNGAEALAVILTQPPDLIILDIWMPVMDGPSFIRAYHQSPGPHAPIIVMSAARDGAAIAADSGADGFLAKPFGLDALLRTVGVHVGRPGTAPKGPQPRTLPC